MAFVSQIFLLLKSYLLRCNMRYRDSWSFNAGKMRPFVKGIEACTGGYFQTRPGLPTVWPALPRTYEFVFCRSGPLQPNYGHFAYETLRILTLRLLFGQFAYWTFRLPTRHFSY